MAQETVVRFADVRLDIANEQVWRGKRALKLTPTAFALLQYLVAHAGQLVTKAELLQAVWAQMAVTEGVLTTHVRQIRQVLGDDPKAPRFIETVHRRGYRFIAPLSVTPPQVLGKRGSRSVVPSSLVPAPRLPVPTIVGREAELAQLHLWLKTAFSGERQIVFVTGEAGIGKTTLVEAFLSDIEQKGADNREQTSNTRPQAMDTRSRTKITPEARALIPGPWIGRGQCIEHYGPGEPYLPILEALGRLCRTPDGRRLIDLLA